MALSNDPVGLAAYILEKFSTWTDLAYQSLPDGGLSSKVKFTMDEMLTDVMIYWVNNCITTSMRLYSESFTVKTLGYQIDEWVFLRAEWWSRQRYSKIFWPEVLFYFFKLRDSFLYQCFFSKLQSDLLNNWLTSKGIKVIDHRCEDRKKVVELRSDIGAISSFK